MSLAALVVSLLGGLALMPLVRRLSFRVGRVALPRKDRWHSQPTPTLGGIAICAAFVLALAAGEAWLPGQQWPGWGFLSGALLMFLVRLYDEFRPLPPVAKLVAQLVAATLVISMGYTSTFFSPRVSEPLLGLALNIFFTFAWLIGITNAINLLDNMDGLAGGIAMITAGVLSYFFYHHGSQELLWVSLALVGSLLAFLVFNFPPARIFMGDSGSLFLGFSLATLAIVQQRQQQASDVLAVLGVPALLFMLPILDTSLVTFTRLLRGQSPAQGGRDHTSHRLVAFGLSERQTLFVLYGVALASAVLAASLERLSYWLSLALAPLLIVVLALFTGYLGRIKVVAAAPASRQGQAIARVMLSLTYRQRVLELGLDFLLITLSYYLAFLARYGFELSASRYEIFIDTLPIALAGSLLAFYLAGVYRVMWRYAGFDDLLLYLQGVVGSVIAVTFAIATVESMGMTWWASKYSNLVLVFYAVFLFIGLAASRSSFRLLDRLGPRHEQPDPQGVLIYGVGDAGEMALRWIQLNPELRYRPLGFIHPDAYMTGRQIHGVNVLGSPDQLERILAWKKPAGLILAGGDRAPGEQAALLKLCAEHGVWVRSLRLEFEAI
ncbi:MAG: hypothetical protein ACKOC5_16290 [Chloroflexota bacterium]